MSVGRRTCGERKQETTQRHFFETNQNRTLLIAPSQTTYYAFVSRHVFCQTAGTDRDFRERTGRDLVVMLET